MFSTTASLPETIAQSHDRLRQWGLGRTYLDVPTSAAESAGERQVCQDREQQGCCDRAETDAFTACLGKPVSLCIKLSIGRSVRRQLELMSRQVPP